MTASSVLAYADDTMTQAKTVSSYRLQVGQKVERGGKNLLFGWTELPKRIVDITKESKNPFWGVLAGTFQGTLKAVARTASGIGDIVTAPVTPEKDAFVKDIKLQ
jgi:putative exosortase-associated protein (TIGR04073 family)